MKRRTGFIILFTVVLIIAICALIGKIVISRSEKQLALLLDTPIPLIDTSSISDGTYTGSKSVFPIKAETAVTISNGIITNIEILKHRSGQGQPAEAITERIIKSQSLSVEAVTGATYSSRVILFAVAEALQQ